MPESTTEVVPTLASIAPPARWAEFRSTLDRRTLRVPALLKIPPPEPEVPFARLPDTRDPLTVSEPPSL